jgi:hypothetical protein
MFGWSIFFPAMMFKLYSTEHAFTALQALNWDKSLTNFHANAHALVALQAQNNMKTTVN